MITMRMLNDTVAADSTPAVSGLNFRPFRGEEDYPAMLACILGSKEADGTERTDTLEDVARNYRHLHNCDPFRDVTIVEVDGQAIGYGRVWWSRDDNATWRYAQLTFMLPAWRGNGIRRALLRRNERRLVEIAADHRPDGPQFFEAFAADTETHWEGLLVDEGYQVVRHGLEMVRPNLDSIPNLPLPAGIEVRPYRPEHLSQLMAAAKEAFRDHWGFSEREWDAEVPNELESPNFQPHLWQIAWDGNEVVGMVQNFINHDENKEYGRKRGYTEGISVRRPWRRHGVARALIARSFQVLKDQGMTEAALGCDAENLSGAVRIYTDLGFRTTKRFTTYRKPLS